MPQPQAGQLSRRWFRTQPDSVEPPCNDLSDLTVESELYKLRVHPSVRGHASSSHPTGHASLCGASLEEDPRHVRIVAGPRDHPEIPQQVLQRTLIASHQANRKHGVDLPAVIPFKDDYRARVLAGVDQRLVGDVLGARRIGTQAPDTALMAGKVRKLIDHRPPWWPRSAFPGGKCHTLVGLCSCRRRAGDVARQGDGQNVLDTFQGLAIGLGFLVPGIVFELGIERVVGYWRTSLSDRLFRFFAESVVLQTVAAPITYAVVRRYDAFPSKPHVTLWAQVSLRYSHLPWLAWLAGVAYVLVPFLLGFGAGLLVRGSPDGRLARVLVGRDLPPRAWDYLFSRRPAGVVRARLKDGSWVAGLYAPTEDETRIGYASSFPAAEDLYLPNRVDIDPSTGEVRTTDGRPVTLPWALLLRRDDVDLLEIFEAQPMAARGVES